MQDSMKTRGAQCTSPWCGSDEYIALAEDIAKGEFEMTTMAKPAHVREWERAEKRPDYRHLPDYTLESAQDRLVSEWLLETLWKVYAFGRWWEGGLCEINHAGDPLFTLKVADPEDVTRTLMIRAPFEQFIKVGKK